MQPDLAPTIIVCSRRAGVGTTTLVSSVARAAEKRGYDVSVVDLPSQSQADDVARVQSEQEARELVIVDAGHERMPVVAALIDQGGCYATSVVPFDSHALDLAAQDLTGPLAVNSLVLGRWPRTNQEPRIAVGSSRTPMASSEVRKHLIDLAYVDATMFAVDKGGPLEWRHIQQAGEDILHASRFAGQIEERRAANLRAAAPRHRSSVEARGVARFCHDTCQSEAYCEECHDWWPCQYAPLDEMLTESERIVSAFVDRLLDESRCELIALGTDRSCREAGVGVRFEDGLVDVVCAEHARQTTARDARVLYPAQEG